MVAKMAEKKAALMVVAKAAMMVEWWDPRMVDLKVDWKAEWLAV